MKKILHVIFSIPLRHKIVAVILLLVILPLFISGFYFYLNISSMLTANATDNLSQMIQQVCDNIENSYNVINITSLNFLSNNTIRSSILGDLSIDPDNYNFFVNKTKLEEDIKYSMLFNGAWDMRLISTAYVFFNSSEFVKVSRSDNNIQKLDENSLNIFNEVSAKDIQGLQIMPPTFSDPTIYFVRYVKNIYNPKKCFYLIIGTDESQIFEKYKKLLEFPGSKAYIIDDTGVIYSSSSKDLLGKKVNPSILDLKDKTDIGEVSIDNQIFIVSTKKISESGLTFIAGIPKQQIFARFSTSMRYYLLITILITIFFIIVGIILSYKATHFVGKLIYNINKVKLGNYDTKMPKYRDSDLNLIGSTFNNMTEEIKYLISQVYEKQLLLKETELKFLQSQMNPHFLFNVLVTIGYKARMSMNEDLFKMVTSLTELLQAGIYSNNEEKITIRQELELIKFYLYLQKMRFQDKLSYSINLSDESILDLYVPKLSIEPIVENAVVHGIEKKICDGSIEINMVQESNCIIIEIIDDGEGFESEDLFTDQSENLVKRNKGHNNIGLNNTNSRIKLLYGERFGITVSSKKHIGTKVSICLPIDRGLENV